MTGLTHLPEERADELADQLEGAVGMMGTNERPIEVTYRLNITGQTSDGQEIPVTEFRIKDFVSMYAEDIPDLLEDDEYIAALGTHLDTGSTTISVTTEETVQGDIFL